MHVHATIITSAVFFSLVVTLVERLFLDWSESIYDYSMAAILLHKNKLCTLANYCLWPCFTHIRFVFLGLLFQGSVACVLSVSDTILNSFISNTL